MFSLRLLKTIEILYSVHRLLIIDCWHRVKIKKKVFYAAVIVYFYFDRTVTNVFTLRFLLYFSTDLTERILLF